MISIQSVNSPSGAVNYYTKDNYYTREDNLGPSAWHGKGAAMQGLIKVDPSNSLGFSPENAVNPTDFANMLNAKNSDQQGLRNPDLVKDGKQKAAYDLTFGAPKSVSIAALMGKDNKIEVLFQESVKKTLNHAEKEYASYEKNLRGKAREIIPTENLTISVFNHNVNRLQEAHLHTHAVIHNQTFSVEDNKLRPNNNSALYKNRYALTQYFYRQFEHELNKEGYATIKGEHGSFELKGISRDLIEKFSQRSLEVKAEAGDNANWNKRNHASLNTRVEKEYLDQHELNSKWENDLKSANLDQQSLNALVERTEHKQQVYNPTELSKLTKISIRSLRDQNNTFTYNDFQQTVSKYASQNIPSEKIEEHFERHIEKGTLIRYGETRKHAPLYTTPLNIAQEKQIIQNFKDAPKIKPFVNSKTQYSVQSSLKTLIGTQRTAADTLIKSDSSVNILIGRPGSGKSYTLARVADAIREKKAESYKDLNILVIAPTHTAKDELGDKLDETSHNYIKTTVAQFLIDDKRLGQNNLKQTQFENKDTIAFIDEASQLSNKDLLALQNGLKRIGINYYVLAGDTKQNGSLEAGSPIKALMESGAPKSEITHNARQKSLLDQSAINALYSGNTSKAWSQLDSKFKINDDYIGTAAKSYAKEYQDAKTKSERPYAIAFDNKDVDRFNEAIQHELVDNKQLSPKFISLETLKQIHTNRYEAHLPKAYKIGESLIFKNANEEKNIKKDTAYKITKIDTEKNQLKLEDRNKNTITWNLQNYSDKLPFDHYEKSSAILHQGARIKFLKPFKDLDIRTKQSAILTRIDKEKLQVKFKGRVLNIPLGDKEMTKHLGLDYVETSYVSQGKSEHKTIVASNPGSGAINSESVLVAITRHKVDLEIHTSDKTLFIENSKISGSDLIAMKANSERKQTLESRMDALANRSNENKIQLEISKERSIGISR